MAQATLRDERRWSTGAWLTLAVAAALLFVPVIAGLASLRYPTDGWASDALDTGAYQLREKVTVEPSSLQSGDVVVAIDGQPLRPRQRPPLPADLHAGQVLHYTVERDGQRQDLPITLVRLTHADLWRRSAAGVAAKPEITLVPTLSFLVALAVFLLRPGSAAARYLLIIFSYYGPGTLIAGAGSDLYSSTYSLPLTLAASIGPSGWALVFFPSWTLLALNLPVRKWPLTRFPRLMPALLYGVPLGLALPAAYLRWRTGDAGVLDQLLPLTFIPTVLGFLLALFGGLAHNFHTLRDPAARAQLRWIAFGMGVGWGAPMAVFVTMLMLGRLPGYTTFPLWLTVLLPFSLAIAITRYRLFDIDVIIRRTLIYSVLTALLALAFFGSVVVLQNLLKTFTGQGQHPLVTVVSTLAIAALSVPLRNRVQGFIDQRFYRRRYDAARTLAAFAAAARDDVDLDDLTQRLVAVADETLKPASIGLWLRPGPGLPTVRVYDAHRADQ